MEATEIRKWANYLKNERHQKRIIELTTDRQFFNDTYNTPLIKDENYKVRLGFVPTMVNNITQQLVGKPRVFTLPKNDKKEAAAKRIASVANKQLRLLSTYPDNPFDISFKDNFMGESWVYLPHCEDAVLNDEWREHYTIPVHFMRLDPMVVFSDPLEEIDGIPQRVLVMFDTFASGIKASHPDWSGKKLYKDNDKVPYLFYFDGEKSYAEADETPLFERENIYGCVPFVHSYSGWGYANETKDPDLLSFSRVRMMRDKIIQVSTMAGDVQKNTHDYAWKHRVYKYPAGQSIDPNAILKNYNPDEDNSVSFIPVFGNSEGMGVEESKLFDNTVYMIFQTLKGELNNEFPQVLQGNDLGSSGRNLDVAGYLGLTLYDCCLNNVANMWAKALDMSFKISNKLGINPEGINENDCNSYHELKVELRKESPNELSRKQAEALTAYNAHTISLKTYLIDGRGLTDEEADKEISAMLAFNAMSTHPFFADLMAQTVAEAQGIRDKFEQWKSQTGVSGQGIKPKINYGAEGGEPRTGNYQSPVGMQMAGMGGNEPRL